MIRRAIGLLVILAAAAAAVVPIPSSWIERWYSEGAYLRLQRSVTAFSNTIDWSLFDLVCVVGAAMALLIVVGSVDARA